MIQNRFNSFILFLCAVSALTGCVSSEVRKTTSQGTTAVAVADVEVLFDLPSRPYKTIGLLSVSTGSISASREKIEREFREAAAKIGANAVVIESYPSGVINEQSGRGRAIIWVEK